VLLTTYPL